MEKKLNKMKSDITARCNRLSALTALTSLLICITSISDININLGNEHANDFVAGFQVGLLCVLLLAFISKIVIYRKALKDEKLLKQIYYKENDERVAFINQQVGKSSLTVTTVILLIAAIVAGYFDITVFITILAVTLAQALIKLVLYWYHSNNVSGEDAE